MRIAYICMDPGIPVFGQKGSSVHVQEIIRSFVKSGAEVELFAVRTGGNPPPGLENITLHKLPSLPKTDLAVREQAAIAMNQILQQLLEKSEPFNMVYERYSLWCYSGMDYAVENKIPGILEINAPLIEEQIKHRGLVNKEKAEQIAKKVFTSAFALICVSEAVANYIIKREGACVRHKTHVIPNGINPEHYPEASLKAGKSEQSFVIGFVGTLKPWHGLPYLYEAFAKFNINYPNSKLSIVGDGPQREELLVLSKKLGIVDAIDMIGSVSPEEIPGLLTTMDVALAPYPNLPDFYFSPLKVYEYMAAGLPVIASRIGQLEELISPGVNGILAEPGNVESLKESLVYLHNNKTLRKSIGLQARKTVLQNHTWDKITKQIFDIVNRYTIEKKSQQEAM